MRTQTIYKTAVNALVLHLPARQPTRISNPFSPGNRLCGSSQAVPEHSCVAADMERSVSGSGQIVAIKIHYLGPGSHEIIHKCLLRVITRINLRDGPEL